MAAIEMNTREVSGRDGQRGLLPGMERWTQNGLANLASFLLATFLQAAPVLEKAWPATTSSPAAIVLRWIVTPLAVAGTFHAVSAATATLLSAKTIQGTNGVRLSYQIKISDGAVRAPGSWTIGGLNFGSTGSTSQGLPPGLSLALSTGIVSGTPTQSGTNSVTITAYEHANRTGGKLTFTLTFNVAASTPPPAISTQPTTTTGHPGDRVTLSVAASGTGPFTYQWERNGGAIQGTNSTTLSLTVPNAPTADQYTVLVTGPGGSVRSSVATIAVVPLVLRLTLDSSKRVSLNLATIAGRTYQIEEADQLFVFGWIAAGRVAAAGSSTTFLAANAPTPQRFWRYRADP